MGLVLSLVLNLLLFVFSTGVLYQRLVVAENRIQELTLYRDKTSDMLTRIQETLGRIDERLSGLSLSVRQNGAQQSERK